MKRATSAIWLVLYIIILIFCTGSSVMAQNSKKKVEELTDEELLTEINRLQGRPDRAGLVFGGSFQCRGRLSEAGDVAGIARLDDGPGRGRGIKIFGP